MIASCITIFSCSVTHKELIFILCHFQSLVLIFQCKSEANSLMWRGNTLNSSNTCLARCNWLNHSWAQSLLCHRKQRESTLRNLNQPHQQSRWKPESVEWEKLSHSCQPPPRQAVGWKRCNCLWKQKQASLSFPRAFHMIKIHFTFACMCLHVCTCMCLRVTVREYYLPGQKLNN